MKTHNRIRALLIAACGVVFFGLAGYMDSTWCLAANTASADNKEQSEEELYKLDEEVQEWLDEGHGIPAEAKYASLSGTGHLWVIKDTDFSDGRIELEGNDETVILYGLKLKDWLKSQSFFGENLGQPNNKIKFIRPKKKKAF